MARDRKDKKFEGVSFNPDAFPEGTTEQQFIEQGLKNKTFAKKFPDEAKQRDLLAGAYAKVFPEKKTSFQDRLKDDLVLKDDAGAGSSDMT